MVSCPGDMVPERQMRKNIAEPPAATEVSVRIEERNGKRRVLVSGEAFIARREWETAYSIELIEHVLRVKGPVWLNDEIMRDEDPSATQSFIRWNILSYADAGDFAGRRLLDFGSGCGASSMVLARMLPETEIVGVELLADSVALARRRAEHYGVSGRVRFVLSPDAGQLPAGIGDFQYVMLSGVYEHLLPVERRRLLPLIWSKLKPGGILFIFETPHRWFPIEAHTTVLPFINYLPDRVAHYCCRRFSRRVDHDSSWTDLLRQGIRGGTVGEVVSILEGGEILSPSWDGATRDQIDLWYQHVRDRGSSLAKHAAMRCLKVLKAVTGTALSPYLGLALKKPGEAPPQTDEHRVSRPASSSSRRSPPHRMAAP